MKKMLKSKKGFSLIELLIVVAILAILAAISINLFGSVLNKQKVKSDQSACSYLQNAIQNYIIETDDPTLTLAIAKADAGLAADTNNSLDFLQVTSGLTKPVSADPDGDGTNETFGPYLNQANLHLSAKGARFDVQVDAVNKVVTVKVNTATGAVNDITINS